MCKGPLDGHSRGEMSQILDWALISLFEAAVNAHGPQHAAVLMWKLTSRDPNFKTPHWLMCVFKRHKTAILADLHERTGGD